jgi:4-amino-4-deoxy-L-arabinose transferase-like glycosyltransferase
LKQAPGLPHYENTPWLFYIILKIIFLIFGYNAEIGRIFILIFAVGSIYLCLKLIRFYTKDRQLIIFFLILICLNPFLVLNSQETRVHSVVLFFGLWNLIQFLKLISQINLKNTITFVVSMVLVMSFSPIASTLLVSYLIYILMIFNKKKNYLFFDSFFIYIIDLYFF